MRFGKFCGTSATMQRNGIFHDSETQTRAAHVTATAFVHAIETLKQMRQTNAADASHLCPFHHP